MCGVGSVKLPTNFYVDSSHDQIGFTYSYPPINFFYSHLHNSIRSELEALSQSFLLLDPSSEKDLSQRLQHLKERYRFLEKVYKYHSHVEDEVVYPALDSKVKNVTLAYSVEHEDEERLFEHLSCLITSALQEQGSKRDEVMRQLMCKVEEIHTTLRKHLAKEEEQLLPLLLQHFTHAEQAELVAQFLYCIPLATIEAVLSWVKTTVPQEEQRQLLAQVQNVVSDRLLLQLLCMWLSPAPSHPPELPTSHNVAHLDAPSATLTNTFATSAPPADAPTVPPASPCSRQSDMGIGSVQAVGSAKESPAWPVGHALHRQLSVDESSNQLLSDVEELVHMAASGSILGKRKALGGAAVDYGSGLPPLRGIVYLHRAIRCALDQFVKDARALQQDGTVTTTQLSALMETHRFVRAVCMFHSTSEDEVMFPVVRSLSGAGSAVPQACDECENEHMAEASLFEELGRLLGDVRACTRRGARETAQLTEHMCETAECMKDTIRRHMAKEELQVLPMLERMLDAAQQREMVWHTLRAMPLRLLEKVMPWVAGKLSEDEAAELLNNLRLAAPEDEAVLVELLARWVQRGRQQPGHMETGPRQAKWQAVECTTPELDQPQSEGQAAEGDVLPRTLRVAVRPDKPAEDAVDPNADRRLSQRGTSSSTSAAVHDSEDSSGTAAPPTIHPIDHIFQFHKALRQELKDLEKAALKLDAAVHQTSVWNLGQAVQELEGRFTFLWGIYQAHSKAEDEIVFPALESKEAVRNISLAYSLDHKQEEQLFIDVDQVLKQMKGTSDLTIQRNLASQLRRMCAAIRASLETHVRGEETELWPVFAEHFAIDEQQHLVGQIIGRTGAEVLTVMLPWVTGSFTSEEQAAMMCTLRSATKNTMFEQWLDATMGTTQAGTVGDLQQNTGSQAQPSSYESEHADILSEVAHYLRTQGDGKHEQVVPESSGLVADNSEYRPGWEDIFRVNQKQLEAAVRRVSKDATLEPQRKAYIIQHMMTSRYIVTQQARMSRMLGASDSETGSPHAPPDAPTSKSVPQQHNQQLHVTFHDPLSGTLGCRHYKRKARLVAPCCNKVFTCRLCHDEEVGDHKLDRYAVTDMVCMVCGTMQPVAGRCSHCRTSLSRYYCNICHLFDDEPNRDIYHCPFCNVCRRGKGLGKDLFHCMDCNACMSLSLCNKHKCRDKALECQCPVCSETLFDSNLAVKELPCGHFMHSSCFSAYAQHSYVCPVCSKSIGDMSVYWRMLDSLISSERQSMPPEYATKLQSILCNDCGRTGTALFHFVYHKCPHCQSYNTRVA